MNAVILARSIGGRPPQAGNARSRGGHAGIGVRRGAPLRPGAPLTALWRQFVNAGGQSFSRVNRAQAALRSWELEARLPGAFHLTLPPDTHSLDTA